MGGPWGSEGTKKKMQIMAQKDEGRFTTSYHKTFNSPAVQQSSTVMGPATSSMIMSVPGNVFNKSLRSPQMGRSSSTGSLQLAGKTMSAKEETSSPARATFSPMASRSPSMTASLIDPPAKALPLPLQMKTYVNRDMRRKCLEILASPNIKDIAKETFKAHDKDGSGSLDSNEIMGLLHQMHDQLDLPDVDARQVESLLKKYDTNDDHTLGASEFFELFKAQLRRTAFDRGNVLGREFFLQKSDKDVWNVYQKMKELGTGSFGTAYLAKQKASGDECVVKAVKKSRTLLPLDEVEQEILIMRQVDHPHVVRLFEWYEDANRIYLILEFLRGGTLKDVVLQLQQKEQRGMKEAWMRAVLEQVAGAMAYCHNLRLIHKDIKDENIMLLKQDSGGWDRPHAVIIDLGIAEMFSVADPTGRMLGGTPTTMAPEVWLGSFGPKCDVWSLGCVFYQMCAGGFPFMARSVSASAWTRLHKRGPKYDAMKTSADSRDLCQAMLTYREQDRPTMLEVLNHSYFKKASHQLATVPAQNFGPFMAACKMQRARQGLLLEIAARLPFSKSSEIINLFSDVDTDHSGTIGKRELVDYFARIGINDQELVQETFNVLDVDKDGALSFSEFAAGALLLFKDTLEDQLYNIFTQFDSDGSGVLTSKEAAGFLANVRSMTDLEGNSQAEEFLRNGNISFAQLRDYLLGPSSPSSKPSTARSSQRSFR